VVGKGNPSSPGKKVATVKYESCCVP